MKRIFATVVFVFSVTMAIQPIAIADSRNNLIVVTSEEQGSGCPYVCKEEYKRCRKGRSVCRKQYLSCLRDCPH